jgi:hypothetical protein
MQQRRLRPGDVLDDYCPRERRITDHAIVAMIDDTIQQTRCVVCDAEHEYKQAKVPAQRRKKTPALFNQVLDGLKAPARPVQVAESPSESVPPSAAAIDATSESADSAAAAAPPAAEIAAQPQAVSPEPQPINGEEVATPQDSESDPENDRREGPFRRQLIRAALPRPEGATPPARAIPEFTIRQPMNRPSRHGRRRGGQGGGHGHSGPMRFGRGVHGQRPGGNTRPGGHGAGGNRAGGSRRGKKR